MKIYGNYGSREGRSLSVFNQWSQFENQPLNYQKRITGSLLFDGRLSVHRFQTAQFFQQSQKTAEIWLKTGSPSFDFTTAYFQPTTSICAKWLAVHRIDSINNVQKRPILSKLIKLRWKVITGSQSCVFLRQNLCALTAHATPTTSKNYPYFFQIAFIN